MSLDISEVKIHESLDKPIKPIVFGKYEPLSSIELSKLLDDFYAILGQKTPDEIKAEILKAREDCKDSWVFDMEYWHQWKDENEIIH